MWQSQKNIKKQTKTCLGKQQKERIHEMPACENGHPPETQTKNNILEIRDLSTPGLCSALQLANEIQALSKVNISSLKSANLDDITEKAKQKAVKKTNIPFTKKIFKDLIDLNVNDEDVVSKRNVHRRNICHIKDEVFELANHYKPDFSEECCQRIEFQRLNMEKVQYYNGVDIYERIESLSHLND